MARVLLDVECARGHGFLPDVFVDPAQRRSAGGLDWVPCPRCPAGSEPDGSPRIHWARVVYRKVAGTAGIIFSNAERSSQLGVTFESNSQKRAFLQEHPHLREFSKGSADDRRFGDRVRARAERAAKRQGFDDLDHKRRWQREERAKGWDPRAERKALQRNSEGGAAESPSSPRRS